MPVPEFAEEDRPMKWPALRFGSVSAAEPVAEEIGEPARMFKARQVRRIRPVGPLRWGISADRRWVASLVASSLSSQWWPACPVVPAEQAECRHFDLVEAL